MQQELPLYEALVNLKPTIEMEGDASPITAFTNYLTSQLGAEIVRDDKLGRRRAAYEMNGFKDVVLVNLLFRMAPNQVEPLRKHCALNEDILRLTLLKRDPKTVKEPAAAAANA